MISLEGTTKDKFVRAQISVQYGALTLTAGAKANVGDDSNEPVSLANLDGLRNKSIGEFGLVWSRWQTPHKGDVDTILDPICERYEEATGRTEGGKDGQFRCRIGWFRKDGSAAGQSAYQELIDKLTPRRVVFAGITGSIAPETFKFVSADTVAAQPSEKHSSGSVSAVAGVALKTNTMTTFSYAYDVAYEGGDKADVCVLASAGGTKCTQVTVGAPGDPTRTNRLSFEAKQFVGTKFAVAPKLNWSVDESVVGVEFPIYLLQAKDGGLTGGVTLGWRSDTKAFTASAFVGPVLKLIARE